eukprot:10148372-Lingulodinium_polyedra.AAC.1
MRSIEPDKLCFEGALAGTDALHEQRLDRGITAPQHGVPAIGDGRPPLGEEDLQPLLDVAEGLLQTVSPRHLGLAVRQVRRAVPRNGNFAWNGWVRTWSLPMHLRPRTRRCGDKARPLACLHLGLRQREVFAATAPRA